jgi:hypothetical protein
VNAHDATEEMRELDRRLSREHGANSKMLAGCHLGLGCLVLHELGWDLDEILELVKAVVGRHTMN